MALKRKYSKQDDIPEALRPFYTKQEDGSFLLAVDSGEGDEGGDTRAKLKQFRNNNLALKKQVEDLQAQVATFKDIDPEKAKKAIAMLEKLELDEDGKAIKEGKFEEVFNKRTEALRKEYDKKVGDLTNALTAEKNNGKKFRDGYSSLLLKDRVLSAVGQVGALKKGAIRDLISRAGETWKLSEDGTDLVPLDEDGEPVIGKKGDQTLTMEEYAASLLQDAPHLFESGQGSGSNGSKPAKGPGQGGKIVIDGNDPIAVGKYRKEIMTGEAVVRME